TDGAVPLACAADPRILTRRYSRRRLTTAPHDGCGRVVPEVQVKGVRIVQVILLVLVAVYLWLFHSANPDLVQLPLATYFVPPIPVVYVVVLALVVGLDIGFVPARL